jgi:hypothetical protein
MMILQAKADDNGLLRSLAEQEQFVMRTLSIWIATLTIGAGVVTSATQAAIPQETPNQAAIARAEPVVGAQSVSKPVASKKAGGEQVAWCYRAWNGTWACM